MNKRTIFFTAFLGLLAGGLKAAEAVAPVANGSANQFFSSTVMAAAFGVAIAAFGGALGQGFALSKAVESIARQPEASGEIRGALLIGLVLIESLVIYALVVSLILIFANPFVAQVVK